MLYEGETNFWLGTSRCDINWTYFKHNMDLKQQRTTTTYNVNIPSNQTLSFPHYSCSYSKNCWFCFFLVAELRKIVVVKEASLSSVDFVLFCTSVVWVAVTVQKKALLVCGGGNCSLPTLPNCRELSLKSLRFFHFGNCDISTLEIVLFPFLKLQYLNFQLQSLCCFYPLFSWV